MASSSPSSSAQPATVRVALGGQPPWLLGIGAAVLLALLVLLGWTVATTRSMQAVESGAWRTLADLHRMQSASRSLLSSRGDFRELAGQWTAAVESFTGSFDALAGRSARPADAGPLATLAADWRRIEVGLAPIRTGLAALLAEPLAARLGDHGLEGTVDLLLNRPDGQAELAQLRRLQRQLSAFDLAADRFAGRLVVQAQALRSDAESAGRSALVAAACLVLAALAVGGWLLLRIYLLNGRLRREIATRRQSQAAVQERERRLQAILASLDEGVVVVDPHGRVAWINPAAERLTGHTGGTALGAAWTGLLDLQDAQNGHRLDLAPGGTSRRFPDAMLCRADGSRLHLGIGLTPISDERGLLAGMVVVLIDLTLRIQLEERLHRQQTMESIGQLAGGVAHDFNNMLAGILGSAELLGARLHNLPEHRRLVDVVITAAGRAATLTRQLLDFSRRSTMQRSRIDLNQLAEDSLRLLARGTDRRITLSTQLEARQSWVDGDAAQLQNVILNLAINARDAMPTGGLLQVVTRNVVRPPDAKPAGACLELVVSDSGSGIPADVLPRIFEPFFTTKPVGRGSGLGLAAVLGTITRHGGSIDVDSRPGRGSSFVIRLPTVSEPAPGGPATESPAPGRRARILVVDDEDVIRQVAVSLISHLGHEAVPAADGREAVELFQRENAAFDLVILDLVMPRLGGREAFTELRAFDPTVRVLFWSGYSAAQDLDQLTADGTALFITKPATQDALRQAIGKLLDGSGQRAGGR
jgi:PAS domain S-box-containing protein